MLVKVLKAFPYAHDHFNVMPQEVGAIVEIDDAVIEGLESEGFIGEATAADIEAAQTGAVVLDQPVQIPADWRDLKWFQMQALARKLGAGPKADKATVMAVIEAAQAARLA